MPTQPRQFVMPRQTLVVLMTLGLLACASHIPTPIRTAPTEDIALSQAQQVSTQNLGKPVRWGGTIITSQNRQDMTELTILAKPLDSRGEPEQGDQSLGRFLALTKGFLDPAIYAQGRNVTVYGKLARLERRKIDQYDYDYPVVQAEQLFLWDVPEKYDYYNYPYWYDPWYPYPYSHPYWHRH